MKKALLLLVLLASLGASAQTLTSVSYSEDASVFLNPERGFYHHTQTHAGIVDDTTPSAPYVLLTAGELDNIKNGIPGNGSYPGKTSLVLRLFYLHEFHNSTNVSAAYITNMQADFNQLRTKGMKAIIRFAYTNNETKKDLGVTVARIQGHLASLKTVIEANQDVILVAQLGLIGTYGESYYTTNFGDAGQVSPTQWNMRSQVVQSFLDFLPTGLQVQLRTPLQKSKYLEYISQSTNAVTEQEAHNTSIAKSRIGHFNDCILSSPDQKIQEFKILRSAFAGLSSTIRIGYRGLKNGTLALGSTESQMPAPGNPLASYALGTPNVTGGVPNWSAIGNVVLFTNGTILELKAAHDATYLYFRVKESGYLQSTRDTYQLFIDTDNNSSTGWIDAAAWSSTGANHVIENDVLKAHTLSGNGFTFNTVSTVAPTVSYTGSYDDQGTYIFPSDIDFVADESKYVMIGGETCAPTTQTECAVSLARMALHRYTFLNEVYHPTVLTGWQTNNCYADFQKKLGYRIRLLSANIQSSVEVGKGLYVSLSMINDGFAAPAKLRKLNLVLRNTSTNAIYTVPFQSQAADARKWQTGSFTVNESLAIPADVPTGTYALSLAMPDASSSLASNAAYAVRFANTGTWDATNGRNNLNTNITITAATTPTTPTIVIDGLTTDWNNVDNAGLTGTTTSIQKIKAFDDVNNLYVLATGTLNSNYQLYIDADGKSFTGYQSWVNGADYKVEAGKLYRHEWAESWVEILTLNSSQLVKNASALEVLIPKTSLYGIDEYVGLGYRDLSGSTVIGSLPATGNLVTYNLINPVSIVRPAITITVNGSSTDWAYVNPIATAAGTVQLMKVYDDIQNVYLLLKGSLTATVTDYDLFFNTDNNTATGLIDAASWSSTGADYAIIGGGLYKHDATTANGVNGWGWTYQSLVVTTAFDGAFTTQELVIPKSKFNTLTTGAVITVGYRKLAANAVVAKLPLSGGMATYTIENPYIPNLQTLTLSDDITNLYATIQGASITSNYKMFLNTDNNTATGYVDAQFWSVMGADYMIENGIFYQYNGTGQAWGWTTAANTVSVVNTQLTPTLAQRVITIPRAQFPTLTTGSIVLAGFANDLVADKLPTGSNLQSYSLTKAYIPALSSFVMQDNSTNIFLTVQGSSLPSTYEAFLNTDNNTSTGFIDATWNPMGADFMIQNGSLYAYSGSGNAWGWTLVQAGLQVNNSTVSTDLYQREILVPRSKLTTLIIGATIKGGYRSVIGGVTAAVIPTAGGAMQNHTISTSYVPDLQDITVSDNSTSIIVTVRGGNLSSTYQVYVNTDNVASSGYSDGTWAATGINHLVENGLLYVYAGTGANWSWTPISGNVTVTNNTASGVTTRTITITKSALTNLAGTIKVGYRNLVSGSLSGKLPADNDMYSFVLLPALQNIGESGSLTFSQPNKDAWFTKTLTRSYNNPVVIISPLSYNDANPATIRVKNVTSNSFQYQIDEWDYLDGAHGSETVYFIVVEAGRYTLDGGVVLEAGTRSVNNKWSLQTFGSSFATVPLVLAQTLSSNEATAVTTRIRWIGNTNFELKIQEEEAKDYLPNRIRANETVGYLAFTEGSGNFGYTFETDGTSRSYNNDFKKIWFLGTGTKASVFAHMQTSYGGNTASLRYKSLTNTNFYVMVQEEQSYDFETEHTTEEVGYLVLGGSGVFQGTPAASSGGGGGSGARVAASTSDQKQVEEAEAQLGIQAYPNPIDRYLTIKSDVGIQQLQITDINGRILVSDSHSASEKIVDTESWPAGFYVVRVLQTNSTTKMIKVVK
ncbi:MAG: DUF4832 domain-containing protein [Cytophagales bacterium]|nr:DUF4832 domain-containing protein [Cytophagales bacterium]